MEWLTVTEENINYFNVEIVNSNKTGEKSTETRDIIVSWIVTDCVIILCNILWCNYMSRVLEYKVLVLFEKFSSPLS